jgi:hypothetical protein
MNKLISASLPYNRTKIMEKLNKLNVEQTGPLVQTSYGEKVLKETDVSNKYYTFDFPSFAQNVMPKVESYFTPTNYLLRLVGGRQELRLIGEEMKINGDTFYRMLSILNSTDKSRALQMNMGLLRLVCKNGLFAGVPGESVQIKGKHYKASLPDKIESFTDGLSRFKIITEQQKDMMSNMFGQKVSYKALANALVRNDANEIVESKVKKLHRLAGKLLVSDTDRIQTVTDEQRTILMQPQLVLYDKNSADMDIDSYKLLNCWTEIYRSNDSGKIARETNRMIGLINTISN